jgi:hypothetical protein
VKGAEKAVIAQYPFARFEASIHSAYPHGMWKGTGTNANALDRQETQRWTHIREDRNLAVAKHTKRLYETRGFIRSYFRFAPELKKLTHPIFHFPTIERKNPEPQSDPRQREDWKETGKKRVQDIREKGDLKPMDDFAKPLESELDHDRRSLTSEC